MLAMHKNDLIEKTYGKMEIWVTGVRLRRKMSQLSNDRSMRKHACRQKHSQGMQKPKRTDMKTFLRPPSLGINPFIFLFLNWFGRMLSRNT